MSRPAGGNRSERRFAARALRRSRHGESLRAADAARLAAIGEALGEASFRAYRGKHPDPPQDWLYVPEQNFYLPAEEAVLGPLSALWVKVGLEGGPDYRAALTDLISRFQLQGRDAEMEPPQYRVSVSRSGRPPSEEDLRQVLEAFFPGHRVRQIRVMAMVGEPSPGSTRVVRTFTLSVEEAVPEAPMVPSEAGDAP